MKKLTAFLCVILGSLSIFASRENPPTSDVLANYYEQGQLCVAVYFEEEICNDIVFVGSYNDWSESTDLAKFVPVEGYEGWYVVAVTDDSDLNPVERGIAGKPVQLRSDGSFSWDYQTGDLASWELISGYVEIYSGYAGEADLYNYDKSRPVVMVSYYFKNHNSPCNEVFSTYTVNLKAPDCGGFEPAIIGDFNGWVEGIPMQYDSETGIYSYTFVDMEGHSFKIKASTDWDWTNQIQMPVLDEETGQIAWTVLPNVFLGAETTINIDYSSGRYEKCDDSEVTLPVQPLPFVPGTTLPLYDFEDTEANADWNLINTDQENFWMVGDATTAGGTKALYITNDAVSCGYDIESTSYVWAYLAKPVTGSVEIAFDWKGWGEVGYDYMQAYLLPEYFTPSAGSAYVPGDAILLGNAFCGYDTWQQFSSGILPLGNTDYYLAFLWRNDDMVGNMPPVAIDNVQITAADVDTYQLNITAADGGRLIDGNLVGEYSGDKGSAPLMVNACAAPYYGFYFVGWSDGVQDQCRSIFIDRDTTITALFAERERVQLTVDIDATCVGMGSVSGSGTYYESEWISISARPENGYHFVEWSDRDCNPVRYIQLTADTTIYAIFALGEYGGKCGANLYWAVRNDTLVITGTGSMNLEYYNSWVWYAENYGYYPNASYLSLPEGLTRISEEAFMGNRGYLFEEVIVPASVIDIGQRAFYGNWNLRHFEYKGNKAITMWYSSGYSPLTYCSGLRYFKGLSNWLDVYVDNHYMLDTVIVTNGNAFYGTNVLYIDNSKSSDTYYGNSYNSDIKGVGTMILPEGLTEIGSFALYNARYLETITIPAEVTCIGESAFEDCRSLDSVIFAGNNLETIGDWAFYNCHELKKITIPEGVTSIGKAAFFNCTYLSELTIPSSVQRIADNGFAACAKLQRMYVNATIPPAIEARTFEDVERTIPVFVPRGTLERYQAAQYWSEFFNIEEYDAPTGILGTASENVTDIRKVLKDGQVLIIRGNDVYTILGEKQ